MTGSYADIMNKPRAREGAGDHKKEDQAMYMSSDEEDRDFEKSGTDISEDWGERIFFRAVNYFRSTEPLRECPCVRVLDLALTFRLLLEKKEGRISSVPVTDLMAEKWGASTEELFAKSVENMRRMWHPTLEPIGNVIRELAYDTGADETGFYMSDAEDRGNVQMYVLSNSMCVNGATELFYTDVIQQFADRFESDVYILPSSIHEVILIPSVTEFTAEELARIVRQVNEEIVSEDEILSDHVYLYAQKDGSFSIAG